MSSTDTKALRGSSTGQLFLHGNASEVAAVISETGQLGWKVVEQATLESGATLALVEGPINATSDAYMERLVRNAGVTFGAALRPQDRGLVR